MSVQQADIFFAPSAIQGRGVFAARDFEPDEVIEVCPLILFPREELAAVRQTALDDYYFDWGDDGAWYAFALGYGSLYNHAAEPNADYYMDFEAQTIDFFSIRPIRAGEEITISYSAEADRDKPLWFETDGKKRD